MSTRSKKDTEILSLQQQTQFLSGKTSKPPNRCAGRVLQDFGSSRVFLSLSVGVKQEDHDALLVEVQRLEAELGKVRQDLLGVMGCKGKCEQLNTLQDTVSYSNIHFCLGFTPTQILVSLNLCAFLFPDISPGVLPSVFPGA